MLKAFILIIITAKELGISDKKDFLFNMSVGYDYEGIRSEKNRHLYQQYALCIGKSFFQQMQGLS